VIDVQTFSPRGAKSIVVYMYVAASNCLTSAL